MKIKITTRLYKEDWESQKVKKTSLPKETKLKSMNMRNTPKKCCNCY